MDLTGTVVDRYEVEAQLGQGSYGAVYRARHTVLDTHVALKVLWPDKADDPKNVERFLREARAAASIGNERIARVIDAGTTADGVVFLALELLEGEDLSDALEARGRLSPEETVRLMGQVLDGLGAAHGQGIVHRDLKPANVFVTRSGDIKILDFGISKILGAESLTERGMALGTPRFMAPEQLSGSRVDARADLYAVGVMIYQMVSGAPPHEGTGYDVIVRRVKGEAPVPLGSRVPVPAPFAEVVHRALATDPADRWPSAGSLRRALEAALRGERVHEPAHAVTLNPSVSPLSGPVRGRPQAGDSTKKLRPPSAPPSTPAPTAALPSVRPPGLSPSRASTAAAPPSQPALPSAASPSRSVTTALASSVRGPTWGWAAIAGLAVLFSLAAGVFGVLAWRVGSRKGPPPSSAAPSAPAPAAPLATQPLPAPSPAEVPAANPVAAQDARPPAPDPSLVEFEINANFGTEAVLAQYLDARRGAFAACAIERPAQIPLIIHVGHDQVYATEHNGYSSTAPSATQCVIDAAMSGDVPQQTGDGAVFVRIPARGGPTPAVAPGASSSPDPAQVGFEYLASNFGDESVFRDYVEARRAQFAACALAVPAEVELRGTLEPTGANAEVVSSTAPAATECVIRAFSTGERPSHTVIVRFAVRIPARGA